MRTLYLKTRSPIHKKEVLLAFVTQSTNRKTGAMVQVYILHPDMTPLEAVASNKDSLICGGCPHRHALGGGCYVNVAYGPQTVYRSWVAQGKPTHDLCTIAEAIYGRKIRWGAYGDPAHIGPTVFHALNSMASGYTAYTHEWKNPKALWLRGEAMASVDSNSEATQAVQDGWHYFQVVPEGAPLYSPCPTLYKDIQCRECVACDGKTKNIQIPAHGVRKDRVKC